LLVTGLISTNNLFSTTSTLNNLINTNITSGTLNVSTGITSNNLLVTGLISTNNLFSTTSTLNNLINTNVSTSTLNVSTGITSSALLVTGLISANNLFSTTSTIPNLINTNIINTNVSTSTLNVSTGITSNTLLVTGLISTNNLFSTSSTLSNLVNTNITSVSLNVSTGITSSALLVTGLISANNLFSTTSTIPNLINTNIINTNVSTSALNVSTGITSNTLLVTGLISTNNLFSTSSTLSNLVNTNITSGTLNVSTGITSSALLVTGLISTNNLFSTRSTLNNLINTNISSSTLNVSTGITSNNLLVTGLISSNNLFSTNISTTNINTTILNIISPNAISSNSSTNSAILCYNPIVSGITNLDFSTHNPAIGNNLPTTRISLSDAGDYNNTFNLLTRNAGINNSLGSRIFINSIGQIGINTTSPSVALDISGGSLRSNLIGLGSVNSVINQGVGGTIANVLLSLKNGASGEENTNSIILIGGGNNHFASIKGGHTSFGQTYLSFGTANSAVNPSDKMIIDSNGRVGINTTTPTTTLDVNGSSRISDNLFVGSTGGNDNISLGFDASNTTGYRLGFVKKAGNVPTIAMSNNNSMIFQVASSVNISNVSSNTYSNLMQLATSGTLTVTGDVLMFGSISDARLKTNVVNINNALDTINHLRPVTFNWKDNIFNVSRRGQSDSGFIAQEVEPVIPDAVSEYPELNSNIIYKNIRHERIIPYLTGAIQELTQQIKDLQLQIDLLKN
jgi:hypothetical protein